MLSDEVLERLSSRLTDRIEEVNSYILKEIGKNIKAVKDLSSTDARKLENVLKYGGSYEKITKKLSEITELNVKDIKKIFNEVSKKNQEFAKQFYDYRNIDFIPFDENVALKRESNSIAKITAKEYLNISKTYGYTITNKNGKKVFTDLSKAYQMAIDRAIIAVEEGKGTADKEVFKILKEFAESGLRTITFDGKNRRLDSAVRMNIMEGLRRVSNENQQQFGKEFDADGIEVSVHAFPAPDHENIQGKQFSKEEFDKLQNGIDCVDYKGRKVSAHYKGRPVRPISELNCHHFIFSVVLGVNSPEYSDKELEEIIKRNDEGKVINGKRYSMYELTQRQRQLELEIRKSKDLNTISVASGNEEGIAKSNERIRKFSKQYKDFCKETGLRPNANRLRVIK